MKKYVNPHNAPLFRGGERLRLMAAIGSLVVLGTLVSRARDPHNWEWFAGIDDPVTPRILQARDRAMGRVPPMPLSETELESQFELHRPRRHANPAGAKSVGALFDGDQRLMALADVSDPMPSESAPPSDPAKPEDTAKPTESVKPADSGANSDDGAKPGAAGESEQPGVYNAANPHAAHLADDVPPPPATRDAKLAQSVDAPQGSAEYQSSVRGRESEDDMPATKPDLPPVDQDPIEVKDFQEEAQAITDRRELRPEEMTAYWHLIDWERQQTFKAMNKRARPDLMYAHLFKEPDRYRGELVRLKLRITRALATDANDNGKARNLARTYEAYGYTDESAPNYYALVLTDLPADFPLRHDMQEDVTFVGYFFKLLAIQSRDDKHRAVPMLIGKLFWHENPPVKLPFEMKWVYILGFGIIAAVMLVVRFTFNLQPLRPRSVLPPLDDGEDAVPIEDWLGKIEDAPPNVLGRAGSAANGHPGHEHPPNGQAPHAEHAEDEPPL